jgi:hypothetical protein
MTTTETNKMNDRCNPQQSSLDDWDDLCLDPHHSSFEAGQMEGRAAGELAGFRDGQALGQTKGLEFGMEIGFIRGVLQALEEEEESISNKNSISDRVRKSMQGLRQALADFPTPDQMLEQQAALQMKPHAHHDNNSNDHDDDSEDPSSNTKLDILAKLQRIRARFKLLMVQLGMPQFSLKQVMLEAEANSNDGKTNSNVNTNANIQTIPEATGNTEW